MDWIFFMVVLWVIFGISFWAGCIYNEGEFVVADFKMLPFMAILGVVCAVWLLFEKCGNKVIWKREPRPTGKGGKV